MLAVRLYLLYLSTECDLILVAGGDPLRGWSNFASCVGFVDVLKSCYDRGVVFVGISAGAILLGEKGYSEDDETNSKALKVCLPVVTTKRLACVHILVHWCGSYSGRACSHSCYPHK